MPYPTKKITATTLWRMMRDMEIGTEIGLAQTEDGDYSYGIRRLPDMFDAGSTWIADYYGGGCAAVFTDSPDDTYGEALDQLTDWLKKTQLLWDDGTVFMQQPDTAPAIVWHFTAERKEPPKNRLACVDFELSRPYRMYVSVPPTATDDEIQDIAKEALTNMGPGEFESKVLDTSEGRDPFISLEDIQWMGVDEDGRQPGMETELPTGTVTY